MGQAQLPVVACRAQDASASRCIVFPKRSFDIGGGVKTYPIIGLLLINPNLISHCYFRISNPSLSVAFAQKGTALTLHSKPTLSPLPLGRCYETSPIKT